MIKMAKIRPLDNIICFIYQLIAYIIKMQKEPIVADNKSCKAFFVIEGNKIYFNGNIDSGNLQKVEQLSPFTFRVTPGFDKTRYTTKKTFFNFRVKGLRMCTAKFIVTRAYLIEQFIKSDENSDIYHPVYRTPQNNFKKIMKNVKIYYNISDGPEISFTFDFENDSWVQFAFSYPYSYETCQQFIHQMKEEFSNHNQTYFHDQTLCYTSEERKLHVISITQKMNCQKQRQEPIDDLFPEGQRPFKINRPKVILSARVHPGQTPASYSLEGAVRFLLNQKDYRSYLLRKNFHFIIIPMLNPEGVYNGMFRNDLNGENLNRMYLACNKKKHISIWSVKKFVETLSNVYFCFDFHAHPSRKGFFIYGNACNEFVEQVQAQIFSKMIQYNCPYFENLDSIYTEKAMNSKDKYDSQSKQGCARVFYHKLFNIVHSYTVECGYFAPTKLNRYHKPIDQGLPLCEYSYTNDWEQISTKQYTPQTYMFLGKSIIITILDLFHINPYSRATLNEFRSINGIRKFTAQRIYNEVERFRLIDSNCYRKIRNIAQIIEEEYYSPRFKEYQLTISQNYGMKGIKKTYSLNSRVYLGKNVFDKQQARLEQIKQKKEKNHFEQEQSEMQKQQDFLMSQKSQSLLTMRRLQPSSEIDDKSTFSSMKKVNYSEMLERQSRFNSHKQERNSKNSRLNSITKQSCFRITKMKPLSSEKNQNSEDKDKSQKVQGLQDHFQKKLKTEKISKIKEGTKNKISQIQKQILTELLKTNFKKDSMKNSIVDGLGRIDRIGSFLKKQAKKGSSSIKILPSIYKVQQ